MGGERKAQRRRIATLFASVTVAGVVTASLTVDRAEPAPERAGELAWPAKIAPVARQVEEIRGLRFRRTVPVRYARAPKLDVDRLRSALEDEELRAMLDAAVEPYVVFGLVPAAPDPAALHRASVGDVYGVYQGRRRGIRIFLPARGQLADSVLAHELAHALEHQHVPGWKRWSTASTSAHMAKAAVVEGSATRLERRYTEAQWTPGLSFRSDGPLADLGATSAAQGWEWFAAVGSAPYVLGAAYLDVVIAQGRYSWDELVADPPQSDEAIVDPLAPAGSEWDVVASAPSDGSEPEVAWAPSAVEVFLLLASRVDAADAMFVAGRADGAGVTVYERDGRRCGDLALSMPWGDGSRATAIVREWIAAAGVTHANLSASEPDAIVLTSCAGVPALPYGSVTLPLAQLSARGEAFTRAFPDLGRTAAPCVGDAILRDEPFREALERAFASPRDLEADFDRAYRRAAVACGARG